MIDLLLAWHCTNSCVTVGLKMCVRVTAREKITYLQLGKLSREPESFGYF